MTQKSSKRAEIVLKTCTVCKISKNVRDFNRDRYKSDGRTSSCKACAIKRYADLGLVMKARTRRWHCLANYGVLPEEIDNQWKLQGSRCLNPHCENRGKRCVDHKKNHQIVRGLLCDGCNKTLGHALDNPASLRWLAEYLEEYDARIKK